MKQRWYKFLCPLLLLTIVSVQAVLAGNGKVVGKVVSAEGDPSVGANVTIEGTTLGGAADPKGVYFILNVPPGTYRVRASGVGFTPKVVTGVRVSSDQILTVDFSLQAEAVGLAEIVVEAVRPIVDRSRTSTKTTLSGDDFQSLPIRDVAALISTSPSTYKGFLRGGKQFETKTFVDGVDVTDQFYAAAADLTFVTPYLTYNAITRQEQASRSSLINLNLSSVEEADVLTGGVGSDYSSATAGIISYSLREGRTKWTGRADFRISQLGGLQHAGPNLYGDDAVYFSTKATLAASTDANNRAKSTRFTYYPGKYSYGKSPEFNGEIALGGPVSNDFGVYLTGGYFDSHGRLPAEKVKRFNSSVKLNYNISSDIRLNATGALEDRGKLFGWKNRNYMDDFRFFLEGVPQWDGANILGSVKLTHVLSKSTFYEFQASIVNDNTRRGFSDDNNNGIVEIGEKGDFLTFADTAQVNRYTAPTSGSDFSKFFTPTPRNEVGSELGTLLSGATQWKIARPGIFYENFTNQSITLKGDITSQISSNHQLRAGVQARFHDLDRTLRAGYIGGVFSTYKNYVEELWNVKPKEYSLYAQDRMEYAGLIINLGFRLDALDLASSDYANYFAPFADTKDNSNGDVRVPVRGALQTVYIGGKATQIIDPGKNSIAVKYFFSPRLGVSHPISDRAAMYFSFSRQQQSQPFSRLYTNYNDFGNPSLPVIVRTDQNPIQSTNYDLGIQWSFIEDYSLDVNAYYRDIQNYTVIGFTVTPASPWRLYNLITDFGYADSRGVEISLRKNLTPVTDFLSVGGRVSYAYSYIKQSAYTGGNQTSFSTVGGDSARFSGKLPFPDTEFYNTIEVNVSGINSTLTGGYDRAHRVAFNLFLRFPWEINLSSIGTFSSGFYFPLTLGDPRARELGTAPWNKKVDFRLEKAFTFSGLGRIALYVDLVNAFNWTNVLTYYGGPGNPVAQKAWEVDGNPAGGPTINRAITQDGSMIYDIPREVYFGLNITY